MPRARKKAPLPKEGSPRSKGKPGEPRLQPAKRKRIESMWIEGGYTVRHIAETVGASRSTVHRLIMGFARQATEDMPPDQTFAARLQQARTERLESLAVEVKWWTDFKARMEMEFKGISDDDNWRAERRSLYSLIAEAERELSKLRDKRAWLVSLAPPMEMVRVEVERARRQVMPSDTEAGGP